MRSQTYTREMRVVAYAYSGETRGTHRGLPSSFGVSLGHRSPRAFPTPPLFGLVSTSPLHCPWTWIANSICHPGLILINQSQYAIPFASDYLGQSAQGILLATIIGPGKDTLSRLANQSDEKNLDSIYLSPPGCCPIDSWQHIS